MMEQSVTSSVVDGILARLGGRSRVLQGMALAGWAIGAFGVYNVAWSARAKIMLSPFYVREWSRIGYDPSTLAPMAYLQLGFVVLYLIPRTSLLGMILLTGYFGGAIASYVRIGEPFPFPLWTCIYFWAGLYLRDERVRAMLPFRR
jgi:hypothetical protein